MSQGNALANVEDEHDTNEMFIAGIKTKHVLNKKVMHG